MLLHMGRKSAIRFVSGNRVVDELRGKCSYVGIESAEKSYDILSATGIARKHRLEAGGN